MAICLIDCYQQIESCGHVIFVLDFAGGDRGCDSIVLCIQQILNAIKVLA